MSASGTAYGAAAPTGRRRGLDAGIHDWQRVSNRLIWVELVAVLITGVIVTALVAAVLLPVTLLSRSPVLGGLVLGVIVLGFLVRMAFVPRRVHAIGYVLREDDMVFRRGILFSRLVAVPYGRMQLIDVNRGPVARLLGLSELRLVTAAASTGVTVPGLPEHDAAVLRDTLVSRAEERRVGL